MHADTHAHTQMHAHDDADARILHAPLLTHGSPTTTPPHFLALAITPRAAVGELPPPPPPPPSPLAALAVSVTVRLVHAHHTAFVGATAAIHNPETSSLLGSTIAGLKAFAATALSAKHITPSTPVVVLHALLLIHRILSRSHAKGEPAEFEINFSLPSTHGLSASLSSNTVTGNDATVMTHNDSARNTVPLPPSLHSPTNLLLAGLLLADSFFSDLPARPSLLASLVVHSQSHISPAGEGNQAEQQHQIAYPNNQARLRQADDGQAAGYQTGAARPTVQAPAPVGPNDSGTHTTSTAEPGVSDAASEEISARNNDTGEETFFDVVLAAGAAADHDTAQSAPRAHSASEIKRDALHCLSWRIGVSEQEFAKWCTVVKRWSSAAVFT